MNDINTNTAAGNEPTSRDIIDNSVSSEYKYGFVSDIDTEIIPRGLNEDVIRLISCKKGEPEWLLDFRLKAYRHWKTLTPPTWAHLTIPDIDFQALSYYAAPKKATAPKALTMSTPSCSTLLTASAYPSRSKRHCRVWQ